MSWNFCAAVGAAVFDWSNLALNLAREIRVLGSTMPISDWLVQSRHLSPDVLCIQLQVLNAK